MPLLDTVVRFILAVLLNGLWQSGILALGAFVALRAMPKANATTRHTILAVAFYASLILPVVTAAITFAQPPASHPAANATSVRQPAFHTPAPQQQAQHAPLPATQTAFALPSQRPHFALPRVVASIIVAAWLLGMLVALARLVLGLGYLERLKRDSLPVPVEYRSRLERWTGAAKGSRAVRLCRSHNILIPLAVGLFDAMILVPDRFLDDLTPSDIDRILLHELAHLRRNDDWINVAERLAQAVFFFNPGILWLIAQLDLEREIACDDWVLQQSEALPYATCLEKIVTTALWPHRAMQAPGMFVTRRAMSVRIERLLSKHRDVRVSASMVPTGLVVAAITAVCVGALVVSPSFAYTSAAPPAERIATASAKPSPRPAIASTQAPERVRTIVEYRDRVVSVPQTASPQTATSRPKPLATLKSPAVVAAATPPPPSPSATSDYIDQLASVGYTNLSLDELIQLRGVGVTPAYIRQIESLGFAHPTPRELVQLRGVGVTPDYLDQLTSAGYTNLSLDELIQLRGVGVTPADIRQIESLGFAHPTVRQLVQLRGVGVTPDYIRELARAGYSGLTLEQLVTARGVGIDAAFIQLAAAHGFKNLPFEKLVQLKATGVLEPR